MPPTPPPCDSCPDSDWRQTPTLTPGTLAPPACPPPDEGSSGGGDVTLGCGLKFDGGDIAVDNADLAGTGLVVGTGCALDVNVGCGLLIEADAVRFDPESVASGVIVGNNVDCTLALSIGCGLFDDAGSLSVDLEAIADGVLVGNNEECTLSLSIGCGLFNDANVLSFDPEAVADGVIVGNNEDCTLSLAIGCGLFNDANTLSVDNTALAGTGLTAGSGCSLNVNIGCGLASTEGDIHVDNAAIAGAGLTAGTGCQVDVDPGCGIRIVADEVCFDPEAVADGVLVGNNETCTLSLSIGCGLFDDSGSLSFDPEAVADGVIVGNNEDCTLNVSIGCGLYNDANSLAVDVAVLAGDNADTALVPMEGTSGGCDTLAVDLIRYAPLDSSFYADKITSLAVASGGIVTLSFDRRLITQYRNEAGLQIDTVIGTAVPTTVTADLCSWDGACLPLMTIGPCEPAAAIVLGGADGADTTPDPGGIVLGSLSDEDVCGEETNGAFNIDSVDGDGSSGGSSGADPPVPYVVRFTPHLSMLEGVTGGGLPGGCQPTYYWTFAGGTPSTSTEHSPEVSFSTAGAHAITLVVTDCCGNASETFIGSVTVNE